MPQDLYQTRLREGELHPDPAQEKAVEALHRLYQDIASLRGGREAKRSFVRFLKMQTTPLGVLCSPTRQSIFSGLLRFARNDDFIKGVYMYGGVGRGKSMLMDLFYDALPEGMSKRRVHFHEFMIELHAALHARRESGQNVDQALPLLAKEIASQARVLCFDEFHVTDVADAMILGRLFAGLYERGVVVVSTSNWEPDRLYEGGLQRERFLPFIALLKQHQEIVHLDSPTDYRTQFLMEEGSYFTPLNAATRRSADTLFTHLTQGEKPCSESFTVKKRKIKVEAAAGGVARFSFAQLCERPHGAEDYLEITRRYHTVFLEDIPALGYDRRNEAKRLMTLIDALYEARTKLVVTAAAPPDKLYRGHDHAFEFERTVSRLQEMQSADYLA